MTETVLTHRRALLLGGGAPVAGRVRLSDRSVRFEPREGEPVEVLLVDVRRIALARGRRGALVLETATTTVRIRCFGPRAVAGLLLQTRAGAS